MSRGLTKDQSREKDLEDWYKNKSKYVSNSREFKEATMNEKNIMKTIDPKYYNQIKGDFNKVMTKIKKGDA